MKRLAPWLACAGGLVLLALVLPLFDAAQPQGVRITRGEAKRISDAAAAKLGAAPQALWSATTWNASMMLEKELERDQKRRLGAQSDPVIGPRLGSYRTRYYSPNVDKFRSYVSVSVDGKTGEVLGARRLPKPEATGANPSEAELRSRADAFVRSRTFPGAPNPEFESARPNVLRTRTDWTFRYRIPSRFPTGKIVPLLAVYFTGKEFAGWDLTEEYSDGRVFEGDDGGGVAMVLVRMATMFLVLLIFAIVFLRKYHAGEVGVEGASMLFVVSLVLLIAVDVICHAAAAEGIGMGNIDARLTSYTNIAFKLLLIDLPISMLLFFGWAIGESFARERWGDRLASFDALVRRDPLNATVGRSVLRGVLASPALAAATFAVGALPLLLHKGWPDGGNGFAYILYLGGPILAALFAACDSILFPIAGMLGLLALASRRRSLWAGVLIAVALCLMGGMLEPPILPIPLRFAFGWGGVIAAIGVLLSWDLLSTVTAVFFGSMLVITLPLLRAARGELFTSIFVVVAVPMLIAIAFAVAGLLTKREVVYTYDDLAPHVKRIVERERVKAEIDAANRIQAALLPLDVPELAGASVASHYRAATEIGGDYFDFLPMPSGEIGIAFGDVSGHGLTSGIVMAMAKSALLVQVMTDASPRAVLDTLNEIVMKTAPRRIMMTFFFGLLDPATHTLRFSSAGHLDPYVFRGSTGRIEPLSSWGFPLGVRRREAFREHEVEFSIGDRLILYSDGLIEAVDDLGEPFGFDRFERTVAEHGRGSADEIKKALLAAVRKFTHNRPPEDDQTLVVVSFDEAAAQPAFVPRVAMMGAADTIN
jgi:hypothetical protein